MRPPLPISALCERINQSLQRYADKDWNYSRIRLQTRPLAQLRSPFVLWIEFVDSRKNVGQAELKRLKEEVSWGGRHGDELGMLEIVSLRLNKALLNSTSDEFWDYQRPVIRLLKREQLETQGVADALWYEVEEISGEDFDSR